MLFSLAQTPLQSATTSQNPKLLQVFKGLILVNCYLAKISMAHHIDFRVSQRPQHNDRIAC
jgi:hypothetical protein